MSAGARSDWLAPAATFALLALGTALAAIALTLALTDGPDDTPGHAQPTGAPTVRPPILSGDRPGGQARGSTSAPPAGPVAELADPAWVTATAVATGIPERALAAYAGAALAAERSHPGCGLGWNTLAAIGLVESEHGTLGGAALDGAGTVTPPIIGIPLDGRGVAKVPDTDHGELDGDTSWDHAVGPMQFIPATWTAHATDGNGDGTADVHNIDDAVLTAAAYLCATGGDLTQPDGWIAAISTYNDGIDYNNKVAEAATTYAAAGP